MCFACTYYMHILNNIVASVATILMQFRVSYLCAWQYWDDQHTCRARRGCSKPCVFVFMYENTTKYTVISRTAICSWLLFYKPRSELRL